MAYPTPTDYDNAKLDIDTIGQVVTAPANSPDIIPRTGQPIKPLAKVIAEVEQTANDAIVEINAAVDTMATYNPRGVWATGANYVRKDLVTEAGQTYVALLDHVAAAAFATDLNASRWAIFQGVPIDELQSNLPNKGSDMVAYRDTLATAYNKTLSDILNAEPVSAMRFINPAIHEAIMDKTDATNIYASFLDMMGAFANGGHLHFPIGQFNFQGSFYFTNGNLRISGEGMGRTVLNQTEAVARNVLRIASTTTTNDFTSLTYYPISAAVDRGAMAVTLATPAQAANFAYGDKAWIKCRQLITPDGGGGAEPQAELVEIASADPVTGIVMFLFPLTKPYAPDASGTIYMYGLAKATGNGIPLENIHISDITLRNITANNYVLWLRHAKNAVLERVQTFGRAGITSSAGSTEFTMRDCEVNVMNEIPDNYLYFLALDKGSKHAHIVNNTFRASGAASLHLHEGTADVLIQGNRFLLPPTSSIAHTYDWPVVSIAGSSWDVRILDNLFINGPFSCIRASNSWKYTEAQHQGLRIQRNTLKGEFGRDWKLANAGDMGIICDGQVTDLEVSDNILDIIVPVTGFSLKVGGTGEQVKIEGNRFKGNIQIPTGVGIGNVRLSGTQTYTDEPTWRNYGASGARGPRIEATTAGETSPRLYFGNANNAGQHVAMYWSIGSTLNFTYNATPAATSGTLGVQFSPNGLNLRGTSKLYQENLAVVGPRKTGWAVDTGVAKRTANASYAAGATLTFSAAYTQAELNALGARLALIESSLQDYSQTTKALKDDLHATAGHGIIGT
jgi:hypothetical protein